jgi:DNA polymerase-3 subunit epsilon/ATP-dependent DNA helicase DinG
MSSLVAVDIETTGLDPQNDAIIEIGAVRFNGHRVEDEWSTLVNPGRHIPEAITQLTGIDDAMLRHAPRLREILPEFQDFAGDLPVVGHSVRFDLGFLQRQGVLARNPIVDTFELASVLLPSASRYNLGALGQELAVPLPATHRALDDARVTHGAYVRLHELAMNLPIDLLAEMVRLGEPLDWDANWFFQQAMRTRSKEGVKAKKVRADRRAPKLKFSADGARPLQPVEDKIIPLDVDEMAAILEYGGPFSAHFDNFEHRPEQVEMLRAVSSALSDGYHLMVEAGTGVGKSFAYLVPAAYFAMQNNTRVIVSTNTINLQDQLLQKDIPALRDALGIDLRASLLKGRANYLCPRRLDLFRKSGPRDADEMRTLAKVMVWQLLDGSGDRTGLNLSRPAEREAWMRISAEDDACTTENCLRREDGICPFHLARQAAQISHILVVNHALLLSDVATGSKVLPEYQYVIIDEGHHLESAVTGALSFRLTQVDLERLLREVGTTGTGVLGRLLTDTRNSLRPSDYARFEQLVHRAADLAFRLQSYSQEFFFDLVDFVSRQQEGRPASPYSTQVRIIPAMRTAPGWDQVEMAWQTAGETQRLLLSCVSEIYTAGTDLYATGMDTLEDPLGSISSLYRRLAEAEIQVSSMIHEPNAATIYWIEVNPSNTRLSLNAAPLRVGPLIEEHLWHTKNSVILASATLTAAGDVSEKDFSYVKNTLGADEADTLAVGSPFDYESSTLVYLPQDMPEPNAPGYQGAVDRALVSLCRATGGRTLALFTSYTQLRRTAKAIKGPLEQSDITVFEQGEGASPNALLDEFRTAGQAVLLGTRSFWEGVDVPGEALQVVVITKLPFDVPSDPLVAARSETFEDPFGEYQLPEAILRFRQGFGRLIRTASDRGVVVVLDRRVQTKAYGRYFIESLPRCMLRQGSLADLPKHAARWLNL